MTTSFLPPAELTDTAALREKIVERVEINADGCWLWTGGINSEGYACLRLNSVQRRVHRLMYRIDVGPIVDDQVIDHLCRVRHCVNPHHLEQLSNRDNILRGEGPTAENARKTHCKRGHEFTPENTHLRPSGWRRCRTCSRDEKRRERDKRREQAVNN